MQFFSVFTLILILHHACCGAFELIKLNAHPLSMYVYCPCTLLFLFLGLFMNIASISPFLPNLIEALMRGMHIIISAHILLLKGSVIQSGGNALHWQCIIILFFPEH